MTRPFRREERFDMARFWASAAFILLAAATLLACGDDKDATETSTGAAGATAAGKRLSDCDYATALVRSMEKFTASLPNFGAIATTDDAVKAFNTFDSELSTLIGELKSYQLSSDVAKVNDGVVAIFEDARKQIPELRGAVETGNTARLTEVAGKLSQDIFPRMDTIQKDNKGAMDKLNRCAGA
ncbi:MAG: hypothetical protein ACRDJE_29395 [Dehalococcoidia bacterium]